MGGWGTPLPLSLFNLCLLPWVAPKPNPPHLQTSKPKRCWQGPPHFQKACPTLMHTCMYGAPDDAMASCTSCALPQCPGPRGAAPRPFPFNFITAANALGLAVGHDRGCATPISSPHVRWTYGGLPTGTCAGHPVGPFARGVAPLSIGTGVRWTDRPTHAGNVGSGFELFDTRTPAHFFFCCSWGGRARGACWTGLGHNCGRGPAEPRRPPTSGRSARASTATCRPRAGPAVGRRPPRAKA